MSTTASARGATTDQTREPIQIEIWSDVVCPWCWLGKHRLEEAVRQLGMEQEVAIRYRAYELGERNSNPGPLLPQLARKFGAGSPEQVREMVQPVTRFGAELGLHFDWDRAIAAPTFDAHRLIQLAEQQGRGAEMFERLHRAHFAEGKNLADRATLRLLAEEVGLDGDAVGRALQGQDYASAVEEDEALARQYGVHGVPFFVLDGRYAVEGAQSSDLFVRALTTVREERAGTEPAR